jgi:exodeoxyribonuclease V alpha subunit
MPAIRQEVVKVTGELTAFRAVGSDGWGIGTLLDAERKSVAVTGKLVGVRVGETVEIEGVWAQHERYGQQLKVRKCTPTRPESEEGVVAWLESTLPGIGASRARALVRRFGPRLWDVIENEPNVLAQIDGITHQRVEAIRAAYLAHRKDRDAMILLRGWGLTDGQIARCVTQWKTLEEVVAHIRANPYDLGEHVYGFGFARSDAVAMKAGVKFDSPARIAAGMKHLLDESTGDRGDCWIRFGALQQRTARLLGVEPALVASAIRASIHTGRVVCRESRIYSARMDAVERRYAEWVGNKGRAA